MGGCVLSSRGEGKLERAGLREGEVRSARRRREAERSSALKRTDMGRIEGETLRHSRFKKKKKPREGVEPIWREKKRAAARCISGDPGLAGEESISGGRKGATARRAL